MAEVSIPSDFSEGGQLFVRNATGLVREVSKWDALIMNTLGMNVALGAVFMLLQAPGNFPGGNMLLSIVIGTLVMAFTLLWVYAEFSAAMPRSGGDYVFVSRALHPIAGWLLAFSQGMWLIFFWIGFNAWFCLTFAAPVALTTIGAVTGHEGFITLSNNLVADHTFLGMTTQWWVILVGALLTFGFMALLIYGAQWYWRVQKWLFAVAGISILLVAALLLFKSGDIAQQWNDLAATNHGLAYNDVIATAKAGGFNPTHSFSLSATILMLPWVFFVVGYAQGSAQIGGEVKRASRTQYFAMVGGVLINGAVLAAIVLIYQHAVGSQWANSLSYVNNTAADKLGTPGGVPPSINYLASILTGSVPLLLLIGVGFILWALMGTPLSALQATRYMLAWSLDRTAPRQLGEVSDRHHTPVKAILLCAVTGVAALVALVQIPEASLLGALMAQIAAFILVSIAGVVFPYRLRQIWEGGGGRRILGVPAVTLAGLGGVIALGGLMIMFIFNDTVNATFAATRGLSLKFMVGVIVVGVVWYAVSWALNKRRGVDLSLSYREIPPE
ncbi:MAG TPA: APC family permease [Nocardioides sp.]|jgi:amino acid transporter|nr:APC family permease [Nocardioides sp.]